MVLLLLLQSTDRTNKPFKLLMALQEATNNNVKVRRGSAFTSLAIPTLCFLSLLTLLMRRYEGVLSDGIAAMSRCTTKDPGNYSLESTVSDSFRDWVRPSVVYGLVHMAKTAGTEINGEMAARFSNVCGNKG